MPFYYPARARRDDLWVHKPVGKHPLMVDPLQAITTHPAMKNLDLTRSSPRGYGLSSTVYPSSGTETNLYCVMLKELMWWSTVIPPCSW